MTVPAAIAQILQDEEGNIGVASVSQAGETRRVPLLNASLNVDEEGNIGAFGVGGESGGTSDYMALNNKPTINDTVLGGNLTSDDLNLAGASKVQTLSDYVTQKINDLQTNKLDGDLSSLSDGSVLIVNNQHQITAPTIPLYASQSNVSERVTDIVKDGDPILTNKEEFETVATNIEDRGSGLYSIGKKPSFNSVELFIKTGISGVPTKIRIIIIDLYKFAQLRMFNTTDNKNGWPPANGHAYGVQWNSNGIGGTIEDEGWHLSDKIFDVSLEANTESYIDFNFDTIINSPNELALFIYSEKGTGFSVACKKIISPALTSATRDYQGLRMVTSAFSEANGGMLLVSSRAYNGNRAAMDTTVIPMCAAYAMADSILIAATSIATPGYSYSQNALEDLAYKIEPHLLKIRSNDFTLAPLPNLFLTTEDNVPLQMYHKQQARIYDSSDYVFEYSISPYPGVVFPNSQRDYFYLDTFPTSLDGKVLTLDVKDKNGKTVASRTTAIHVSPAPASPATVKKVLAIGDSLTDGNPLNDRNSFVTEMARRLLKTTAPASATRNYPEGYGLTNIEFIGSMIDTHPDDATLSVKNEGHSGWSWATFTGSTSPFVTNLALDFTTYGTTYGVPDVIVICLTWNAIGPDGTVKATEEAAMTNFLTALHSQWPNAKVYLSAPPRAPINGYIMDTTNSIDRENYWFAQKQLYMDFADGNEDWVFPFDISATVHNDLGYNNTQVPAFYRMKDALLDTCVNADIHPNTLGQWSMADQAVRCICHYLANSGNV